MKAVLEYLIYMLKHKYYTFKAGRMIGVPFMLLLTHDLSKFLPDEWIPYITYFYAKHKPDTQKLSPKTATEYFNRAWLSHYHRNKHHWQHWVLASDLDGLYPIPIPLPYAKELLADWLSFNFLRKDPYNCQKYYEVHKRGMVIHPITREWLETMIATFTPC